MALTSLCVHADAILVNMASEEPEPRQVQFGPFVLDTERLILRKGQVRLRLRRQACRLLVLLVRHHDQFVARAQIEEHLWDGGCPVDVEPQQRITWCIALIRRALGDSPSNPRYIATRQGGYEFLGPVQFLNTIPERSLSEKATSLPPVSHPPPADPTTSPKNTDNGSTVAVLPFWRRKAVVASTALLLLFIVAGAWWLNPSTKSLQLQQLTTASPERTPQAVALSPDGKYLAFADKTGAYLQVIDSTEVHPVLSLRGFRVLHISWGPDSTTLAVCATPPGIQSPALFVTSIFTDEPPRQVAAGAGRAAFSWTGDQIAFVPSTETAVWVVGVRGDNPRPILETGAAERITELAWAPDSRSVIISRLSGQDVRYQLELQSVDLDSKRQTALLQEPLLQGFSIARNGRLVCSIARSGTAAAIYEARVGSGSSLTRHLSLRQLGGWGAQALYDMSISADGRRLVFLQGNYQADAYIAPVDREHIHLGDISRVTMDNRNDFPTAWTSDADAIIHHSERNGHYAIFKQPLGDPSPIPLVLGSGDYRSARVTPDGQYVFYEARPTDWLTSRVGPAKLMLIPMQGGASREVLTRYAPFSVRCAQLPARACAIMDRELRQLVFSRLDPALGIQEVLAREPAPFGLQMYNWDLSPDGTMVALALNKTDGSVIRIIDLGKKNTRDIPIAGSPVIQSLDWSPDARGWYVSSPSLNGATLSFLKRTGEIFKLRDQPGSLISWAVPSRDGHLLAILEWTVTSNAWMLDTF